MRLIMRSGDVTANLRVDAVERVDDVLYAYRKREGEVTASEFAGMFSLGSVDFVYTTPEGRADNG